MPAAAAEHCLGIALAVVQLLAALAAGAKELPATRGGLASPVDLARCRPWRIAAVGAAVGFLVGLTSVSAAARSPCSSC